LHDPLTYSNPDVSRPERFLGEVPEQDPSVYVFGFGRRSCPGRLFAERSVFLACAMVLATLNIHKAVDERGEEIEPTIEYDNSITVYVTSDCRRAFTKLII
jgi:cytochrome P450